MPCTLSGLLESIGLAGKPVVIEVNDNPSLDAGCEDEILRDDLYRRIMEVFLRRIESKKAALPVER